MAEPKIIASKFYPYNIGHNQTRHNPPFKKRNCFMLGLGSNTPLSPHAHPINCLDGLFAWLHRHPKITILQASPIYRNPPFGFIAQEDFYNALLLCESDMGLYEVFGLIFYLERRFKRGRKRAFKNAPRTLDIDLIFFNDLKVRLPKLHVPHRFYKERTSVLVPLSFML